MTQIYASVAIGTAAALLVVFLLLMRAGFPGRRTMLELTRQWIAADTRTSCLVLSLLTAIAACAFALIPANEPSAPPNASALTSTQGTANALHESSDADQALAELRAYVNKTEANQQSTAAISPAPDYPELPDVDTMIEKLVARLQRQPDDVKGWKMLGWSYLNMDRPGEATRAYETALELEPGDMEIKKALAAAKSGQTGSDPMPSAGWSDPATSPTVEELKAAEGRSGDQASSVIAGMVDQLDTRLENSPNDESGWLRLIRSRMVLGEKDAAKTALMKALETFASDAAAKARLTAAARELGIESN